MVKSSITCISLLFIGCGISYFCFDRQTTIRELSNNELLVNEFFEKPKNKTVQEESKNETKKAYIAVLEIPTINFKRGLFEQKNPENELSKNIIFLDSSDMPNKDNSRVIIAGHSGDPSNAYFKNLYKLRMKDKIILYYKNIKYTYIVSDIYDIRKNGTLALESNKNKKTLTLVTCKGNDKQLVIISTLIKEENVS